MFSHKKALEIDPFLEGGLYGILHGVKEKARLNQGVRLLNTKVQVVTLNLYLKFAFGEKRNNCAQRPFFKK